jgi:predicted acyltransferase
MSETLTAPAQASGPATATADPSRRLLSLDALRGFDMFWIVGGEEVIHSLYKAWPSGPLHVIDQQMDHQPWKGVHFYDMIFPIFVFIIGVSLVFSLTRMIEQQGRAAAIKRIFFRSVVLYIFGLIVYGGISKGFDQIRWLGVLQRLALCYFFAGLTFCTFRLRGIISVCAALLVGYWALVCFVPVRDFNLQTASLKQRNLNPNSKETRDLYFATEPTLRGSFEDGLTLPQHIDYMYLPGYRWDGAYDPEGLLSTLPAIANCLLGVLAGLFVRNSKLPDQRKVLWLVGAGLASVLIGFLWGLQFPIIKKIWTSSYVLVVAGYASIFLGVFYQVIEIWHWRKWCLPFVWIGTNAITIYMLFHLIEFKSYAERVAGGPIQASFGRAGELLLSLVVVALTFAIVRFLYNRKLFLRL